MNPTSETIDIPSEAQPQTMALSTHVDPPPPDSARTPITAAQGKVEAIANLTFKAYERAGTLQLTEDEAAKLKAEFPDEAFKPGAAGKENLLYIEHPFLRERFTDVFGMGGWALIQRNRWAEPFILPANPPKRREPTEGSRVYVEAMLVIRGCFVAEAVGEMEYYPRNLGQNYGDALEGATTAAFRRCAKNFGVGLQAWKKDWCDGWWARKGGQRSGNAPSSSPPSTTYKSEEGGFDSALAPAGDAASKPATKLATEAHKQKMLQNLFALPMGPGERIVTEYFQAVCALLPNGETLADLKLQWVPATPEQMNALAKAIADFENGDPAVFPWKVDHAPEPAHKAAGTKAAEPWESFPLPFGKDAGTTLRALGTKKLFGWWKNFKVETEYNGKPKRAETIAKDKLFRNMLDAAGAHFKFGQKDAEKTYD